MKLYLILTTFFLSEFLSAQIAAPYYQNFDKEFNFWSLSFENNYVPNSQRLIFDLQRWAPREKNNYFQNYWYLSESGELIGNPDLPFVRQDLKPQNEITWDEPERMQFVRVKGRKGKSIKLTTLDQFDNAGGIDDSIRSRTEIVIYPEHGEDTEFYYSWSFLIPNNQEHPDDPVADNIIAQWHEPIDKTWNVQNAQPPFFLSYKNDTQAKDNYRKLGVMYGLRYDDNNDGKMEGGFHSFPVNINIEKGKWTDIVLHIKWSSDSKKGFLEMWVNGEQVVYQGETRFYAANLYTDRLGKTYPNIFKIGQYRIGQSNTQSIYIDDFRIGKRFEEVNTRLKITNCENEKGSIQTGDILRVNEVIGASTYQFYIVNADKIISSRKPFIKMKKKWLTGGSELEIKARVGVYSKQNLVDGFGHSCIFD